MFELANPLTKAKHPAGITQSLRLELRDGLLLLEAIRETVMMAVREAELG